MDATSCREAERGSGRGTGKRYQPCSALTTSPDEPHTHRMSEEPLNEFIGGTPLSAAELATRYTLLARGSSADGTQLWFNWMMRATGTGRLVGTVQATVECIATDDMHANVAWVVGPPFQGSGYAEEGACAMVTWLRTRGVRVMEAYIHPDNLASAAVARSLDLSQTSIMEDGEFLWTNRAKSAPSCC